MYTGLLVCLEKTDQSVFDAFTSLSLYIYMNIKELRFSQWFSINSHYVIAMLLY